MTKIQQQKQSNTHQDQIQIQNLHQKHLKKELGGQICTITQVIAEDTKEMN